MTYDQLKQRRNDISSMLTKHSDLRGHRTYKKMEEELSRVKSQIKKLFREDYHGKRR